MKGLQFICALSGSALLTSQVLAANTTRLCTSATFSDVILRGGQILGISTKLISNFSAPSTAPSLNHYPEAVIGLNVCEANITYTHPGQNDTITASIWLPLNWNGRMMGIGGGGWMTGYYSALPWPASHGYAAVMTDGGHALSELNTWGLKSQGNVDWVLLNDFASIAVDDAASLAKAALEAFYGEKPKFSYWNGCSTGGRQGYMLAQRYPQQYDGILATAPAINWDRIIPGILHAQVIMNQKKTYPPLCEVDAFTAAAVSACDGLDGVKDGFILDPSNCKFDPKSVVGQPYSCSTGPSGKLTSGGAEILLAAWSNVKTEDGQLRNGRPLSYGASIGAPFFDVTNTGCISGTNSSSTCTGAPLPVAVQWLQYYLAKDEAFNFGSAGGKLLTWHGLNDELLNTKNTIEYWERVKEQDPEIDDYYRLFEAPGTLHCKPGYSWFPGDAMESLLDWVENDVPPEHLKAKTVGSEKERVVELCKWPAKLKFVGGDSSTAESYVCV